MLSHCAEQSFAKFIEFFNFRCARILCCVTVWLRRRKTCREGTLAERIHFGRSVNLPTRPRSCRMNNIVGELMLMQYHRAIADSRPAMGGRWKHALKRVAGAAVSWMKAWLFPDSFFFFTLLVEQSQWRGRLEMRSAVAIREHLLFPPACSLSTSSTCIRV